ncbi:MAG: lactate utilization protein [Epsilonproteobacteria bacterium]|nr:lactate utilization protein [Campylobacterota bacterium]
MSHRELAKKFLQDKEYLSWHDRALWYVREKRDKAIKEVKEWEELREAANIIKEDSINNLGYLLDQFIKNAKKNNINIHLAKDAKEHNKIVLDLLKKRNITQVLKSKSMLTEECNLNEYLQENGIEVIDTDLGERIVQLNNEKPSHIVLPAIHLKKEKIAKIFAKKLNSDPNNNDPLYLTEVAKRDLREKFLKTQAAISGVNFAIAQSGGIVICTNEGNADIATSLAKIHIASMGIEKLIPTLKDLSIFLRLLARSATGQPITTYTTHINSPALNQELHIIIVDNQRSSFLNSPSKEALYCIRCGACMNTCPVFRRSSGHSYSYTIPGPIGSILASFRDKKYKDLPFACTLCSSCDNVCPVKIKLHNQLLAMRNRYFNESKIKKAIYKAIKVALKYNLHKYYKTFHPLIKRFIKLDERELIEPAKKSFSQLIKEKKDV